MSDENVSADITSDDKLWVLLAYIIPVIIPIVILLMEDKKNRPFIRAHNIQALILGIVGVVCSVTVFLACISVVVYIAMIYWGIQGYQGKYVTVPVLTDFIKKQGWA